MEFNIFEKAKKKIIIAAHRGSAAGNIPCNTLPAYRAALDDGADMLEIDVDMSADGKLYIFHPSMEKRHLGIDESIRTMTSSQISTLRYQNYDRTPTQFGLNTLDEIFEEFREKCFINVDKFWDHPEEIYKAIKRHKITEQILVKSTPSEKIFNYLESSARDVAYMPIVSHTNPLHQRLMESGINYVGAEVLFDSDEDEVASEEFINAMHRDGKLVWANAIIYSHKAQLSAGHSDDTSICGNPDLGWGWLAKRGYDIIQTDWTGKLVKYLEKNNLLFK